MGHVIHGPVWYGLVWGWERAFDAKGLNWGVMVAKVRSSAVPGSRTSWIDLLTNHKISGGLDPGTTKKEDLVGAGRSTSYLDQSSPPFPLL